MRSLMPVLAALIMIAVPAYARDQQDQSEVLPGLAPPSVSNNTHEDMLEEKKNSSSSSTLPGTGAGVLTVLKGVNVHSVVVSAYEGNKVAQYELGLMLLNGTGVAKDVNKSVSWFQRSATQGVTDAQWELSQLQLQGVTHADKSATYKWMLLSEGKNPDRIAQTKKVEAELPPELVSIIQKQTAVWKPIPEPFKPYTPPRR
jgi:hypothetical protein